MSVELLAKDEAVFATARRVNEALTARIEKRALVWMAERAPGWVSSDGLTLPWSGCSDWRGDLLCVGALRPSRVAAGDCVRGAELAGGPSGWDAGSCAAAAASAIWGFLCGSHGGCVWIDGADVRAWVLAGMLHWQTAIAMLITFLLLSSESYLATYTLSCFELSQGLFGPTEIRILLIVGNLALLRSPYSTVFGHRLLLFDVGGMIAAVGMFAMGVLVTVLAYFAGSIARSRCAWILSFDGGSLMW